MIPFILVRMADIGTTLWAVQLGASELNPVNSSLLEFGYGRFLLVHLALILMIWGTYMIPQAHLFRKAIRIFTLINVGVVLVNLYVLFLIYYRQGMIL